MENSENLILQSSSVLLRALYEKLQDSTLTEDEISELSSSINFLLHLKEQSQ